MYGEGIETRDAAAPERVWFKLARNTRIGLEPVGQARMPRFVRFGSQGGAVRQRERSRRLLRAAGAEVLSVAPSLIRFRDNYGITLEVRREASEPAPPYCRSR